MEAKETDDSVPPIRKEQGQQTSEEELPIEYHYLTFETELPLPVQQADGHDAPLPPNLTPFISPFNWSSARKTIILSLCSISTGLAGFCASSYSPAVAQLTAYWNISDIVGYLGVTVFTCGFAVAPMALAPFSEIHGRRPVFLASAVLFVACQLWCAATTSFGGMLAARFLAGVGGSTFSTMVGGVVSDIYHAEERNAPMALFSCAALFGTGFGAVISALVAEHTTWRWVFYMQAILHGVVLAIVMLVFRETRGSVLLSWKARALNGWYEAREAAGCYGVWMPSESGPAKTVRQRVRWKVKADEERSSLLKSISISIYRPLHLLVTEPVVFFFSLWVSFAWAVLYLTLAAIPLVFSTVHNFTISQSGAVFSSMCIGSVLFAIICIYQEKLAKRHGKVLDTPEGRLYFSCVQSILLPAGLFMFGWTSFSSIHWIAPTIGIGIATMGIFSIYLACFNYLADTYHRYASSAIAAQSFCRNMLGGAFPLITRQMYQRMTYGGASSFLGGFSALLTIVPWVLVFWGPRIRARSKFASELLDHSSS